MSRSLSLTLRQAMNAEETGEIPIVLVTIEHDDLEGGPIRLSSDPTEQFSVDPLRYGTTSRGSEYDFCPFSFIPPEDGDEAPPAIQFRIDFVSPEVIELLRSTATPAKVTLELVISSALDEVEIEWPEFDLVNADYGAQSIDLTLSIDGLVTEPYPAHSWTPALAPGLF